MSGDRSREALLDFLEYLASKGLMAKATANARRAAANQVFGILSEEEAADVTLLDLEEVMSRFQNLQGKGYKPRSLATYAGRVKSAVEDFEAYLKNPLAFRPNVRRREKSKSEEIKPAGTPRTHEAERPVDTLVAPVPVSDSIVPIPIRQGLTVHVQGLPFDLTETEAERIANVIRAMATPV